jgi:hypothetical protein
MSPFGDRPSPSTFGMRRACCLADSIRSPLPSKMGKSKKLTCIRYNACHWLEHTKHLTADNLVIPRALELRACLLKPKEVLNELFAGYVSKRR